MQLHNTAVKIAVLVVALATLAIGMTGSWMMWSVVRHDNIDNDLFMKALALMMLAVTCFMLIGQLLKEVIRNTKKDARAIVKRTKAIVKATKKSLVEIISKTTVFKKKEAGQQA